MKIAIVVHGRFHAFDLARALLKRGHEVNLFTNYPRWAVKRFGFPCDRVRSFWFHGILSRLFSLLHEELRLPYPEAWLHRMFGRWAAREVATGDWDVICSWSGISEEILCMSTSGGSLRMLMRGSSDIRWQSKILKEEEKRTGVALTRPSPWMIEREKREYNLADTIIALSSFSYETFIAEGVSREKLALLPLGVGLNTFRPSDEVVRARCKRILSGGPLRVLNVGTFSVRKGMWDMAAIIKSLDKDGFEFFFVGPVAKEGRAIAKDLRSFAKFVRKQPQWKLSTAYAWADLFILPTIEEGFPMVLGQAAAAALPILTTPNGAGRDLVRENQTGWILPIRSPQAFIERLQWCGSHRKELAQMVRRIYEEFTPRDWSDVAEDFEAICGKLMKNESQEGLRDGNK